MFSCNILQRNSPPKSWMHWCLQISFHTFWSWHWNEKKIRIWEVDQQSEENQKHTKQKRSQLGILKVSDYFYLYIWSNPNHFLLVLIWVSSKGAISSSIILSVRYGLDTGISTECPPIWAWKAKLPPSNENSYLKDFANFRQFFKI